MAQPILGVLFGGKSNEHDVSLLSAAEVLAAIDRENVPHCALYMDRSGQVALFSGGADEVFSCDGSNCPRLSPAVFVPGGVLSRQTGEVFPLSGVLPVVHGGMTEDGRLQGAFDLLGIPYAGSGAEACAVTMNKALTKTLLSSRGVPVANGIVRTVKGDAADPIRAVEDALPYPVFVKPARSGSSIGAGIARNRAELTDRIAEARKTDSLILFEELIVGREIEVGILCRGDGTPEASPPGELFCDADFYDYSAKYGVGAKTVIPADLPADLSNRLRELALRAFALLGLRHYARVDFFVTENGSVILNEVNALPGLTRKSMFPTLADAMGVPFPALIRRLVRFATGDTP